MTIIGIDIDDTLTETTLYANKYYIKKFNQNYNNYHDLPQEEYTKFLKKYQNTIISNVPLKEGVKQALESLDKAKYQIIIVTSRNNNYSPFVKESTINYFKKHSISYDKIVFNDIDNNDKSALVRENNIDIMIDDKLSILDKISQNNKNVLCLHFANVENSKYKTFNNWHDIIEYIKEKG